MRLFCERCCCEDPRYFVFQLGQWVCRRCIQFNGQEGHALYYDEPVDIILPFQLTQAQQMLSQSIAYHSQHMDVLVHAVCGAGKTELMYETIRLCVQERKRIAIAVARRQVVLQLHQRIKTSFPDLHVIAICEGHTSQLEGHLIVCTTHQLYRFHQTLDVLIIDEPDAFPFSDEPVLQGFAKQACIGHTIYLTATPSINLFKAHQQNTLIKLDLMRRPHGYDLPVPQVHRLPKFVQAIYAYHWIQKQTHPSLIFVPSIRLGMRLSILFRLPFAYANHPDLDRMVQSFKAKPDGKLMCTTVLERGVTFEDVQVCVLQADHRIFKESTLTQIAGRVGRSFSAPTGEVLFLCSSINTEIQACLNAIHTANNSV
jgi:competence protein ComFA